VKLYDYFRSSAAYRVRIALALKGFRWNDSAGADVPDAASGRSGRQTAHAVDREFVHLRNNVQRSDAYLAVNPHGLVPSLVTDEGAVLTQSLAIIEWLDETRPDPPLLPPDPAGRARVRAIALAIACDIHPIDNLRVLRYLVHTLGLSETQKDGWYRYWIDIGFEALERQLAGERATGRYCHGDRPTLADVCLVPQLANARRMNVDLAPYPTLLRIGDACAELPAFARAAPEQQPDAE
jgi:maleylacetoacetate isomerase